MNALAGLLVLALILLPAGAGAEPLRVLATFLPMYLFTKNVVGDAPGVTVDLMLPASMGCPHDYALTPADMRKIAAADIIIANGLGMEAFLGQPVGRANIKARVIETAASVPPIRTGGGRRDAAGGGPQGTVNPHTWVSPRNAVIQVRSIEKALSAASPRNAALFRRNADAYAEKLGGLAAEYGNASRRLRGRGIVTQHDAFDYLARDAGLSIVEYIEEMPGEEPSAGRIHALIRTIRARKAMAVFAEPGHSRRLAETVGREAGVPVRMLDPVAAGSTAPSTYEDVMRSNLRTLLDASRTP